MATEAGGETRVAARTFAGPRVEAVLALVVAPIGFLIGVVSAIWRMLRPQRTVGGAPELAIVERVAPLRDVASFAASLDDRDFSARWGFGGLDFQLAYAPDIVPSTLDMSPSLTKRFFHCPPPFEPTTFESLDGTSIAAEFAIRDDCERPGLVVVHGTFGSSGQRIYAVPAVTAFAKWGFNVVAIDLRGWGRSAALSDAPLSGGWREAEDVLAAAMWLKAHSRTSTVGAMGYSLGAAAALLAATHERAPDALAAGVFSESGFVDARAVLKIALENPGLLTREYVTYLIFHYGLRAKMLRSGDRSASLDGYFERVVAPYYETTADEIFDRSTVLGRVDEIRVPAFHLHAADDWVVSVDHAYALAREAARVGNPLVGVHVTPRGAHCGFARVAPAWRERVARDYFAATSGIRLV